MDVRGWSAAFAISVAVWLVVLMVVAIIGCDAPPLQYARIPLRHL